MPMSTQDALNQISKLRQKGDEMSEEDRQKIAELQEYLNKKKPGQTGLGNRGYDQMAEMED